MSRPPRSAVRSGPIQPYRKPGPAVIAVSISSAEATPSASKCSASRTTANCSLLPTNPGMSCRTRIGRLPSLRHTSINVSAVSSDVCSPRVTSTRGTMCGGFQKCIPATRSGRRVALPIAVMDSPDVLVANRACAGQTDSMRSNVSRFKSRFSDIASTRRSIPLQACSRSVVE